MTKPEEGEAGLRSREWEIEYRTSALSPSERPVDILHEFYIPVLRRSVRYDRMAGYFSSSSLAAASQGFSAFVGKRGRARLIVGADIAPHDAEAIIRGNEERHAKALAPSLEGRESWPQGVRRGVELLAWMVANEYLDVRIAFRIHAETRQPIPYLSNEDGYMHEKWAVFEDELGNRLLASGSLNESQRALVKNAENLDIHCDWWGDRNIQRIDNHHRDFNLLWRDRHPHFRVLTLPEAIRHRLVSLGRSVADPVEIDGTSAAPRKVSPPSSRELLEFALIRDGPKMPRGRYVGMETAPVEPWPHQAIVARRLVETWPYSYLLCDEVGLGKTIEAGLAIRSLYLSGFAKRILVAPPASLKAQWQREMQSKFLLPFAVTETSPQVKHSFIHPYESDRKSKSPFTPNLNILSSAILGRRDRMEQIASLQSLDILLIDEAHACRRQNPTEGLNAAPRYGLLYQAVENHLRGAARALWLATATPMQLEKVEAWDLLRFMNRDGPFQSDPTLTFEYYSSLGDLATAESGDQVEWDFLRESVNTVRAHDPLLWKYLQDVVIDAKLRHPARRWLVKGVDPSSSDRRNMARLIFSVAPLSRVMLRHTRDLLEIYKRKGRLNRNLATREIQPIPNLQFNDAEEGAYWSLESYCDELSQEVNRRGDENQKYNVGFYRSFLRLRFASSFFAIRETIRRRRDRVFQTKRILEIQGEEGRASEPESDVIELLAMEPEEEEGRELEEAILKNRTVEDLAWELGKLDELAGLLDRLLGPSTKMQELLSVLEKRRIAASSRIDQTVIFTRFFDTLTEIVLRLRAADQHMLIGTYSGQGGQFIDPRTGELVPADREHVKHKFLRGEIDLLVCTDAAAEGLNLQTANLIINFDLPWNPMKVEQRIGRLDRIGQTHEHVYVLNLCYVGSAEEIVYGRLLRRLQEAGMVVGSQPISMLPVTPDEFRGLADGQLTEKELEERAMQRANEQRELSRSMEIPATDLFEIYMRLEREASVSPAPVGLSSIWEALSGSKHLRDLGCQIQMGDGGEYMLLAGIEGVPDRTPITASRDLYERGLPGNGLMPHFASYGDMAFDAIIEYFRQFELPPCIKRIEISKDDSVPSMVGYVAASQEADGSQGMRLLTEWGDLEDLALREGADLPEADLHELERQLRAKADREWGIVLAVPEIERTNLRAATAHLIFAYLLAQGLIDRCADGSGDNFWDLVKQIDEAISEDGGMSITPLPAAKLRELKEDLMFEPKIPTLGDSASILASPILLRSALGAACRQADAMRVRKSDLTVSMVLDRLERRVEEEMREYASLR